MRVVSIEPLEGSRKAYDVCVAGTHAYFVGDNGVLAHNCQMTYENGALVLAATRGDGDVGEDITRNVFKMKGVVPYIKGFTGHIRGEIVLTKTDWKKHFPTYSNPRNAASGIAKREDGVGAEHLTVMSYRMLRAQAIPKKSIEFQALARVGCLVPRWAVAADNAAVLAMYQDYIKNTRVSLDYDIDGLVIEMDDIIIMDVLGDLNKRPRGAVALKFPAEAKGTVLQNIRWQVGKSGRITPVGEFDPVDLAGARIEKASLHNLSIIKALTDAHNRPYLRKGDIVVVSRRNDVIPYIEEVLTPSLTGDMFIPPTHCPECGTATVMHGEYLVCRGEDCPAQVLGAISRWVNKTGVLGFGDTIIEALIEHAGVEDAADLYVLDPKAIENIPSGSGGSRLGRTAHVVLEELHNNSEIPLHVFVGSLGIPLCARSVCKMIVDAGYDTLDKMGDATLAQIASIPKLGATKAEEFVKGFRARRTLMDRLLDNGVTIKAKSVGSMTGKSVCFTGVRSPELEKAIEDAGGSVKGSVGAGLTYLVQKDKNSQSGKTTKAVSLGVQIVDLDGMWAIVGKQGGTQPVTLTAARTPKVQAKPVPVASTNNSVFGLFGGDDD